MSRVKNTATAEGILRCLKTEVSCLDPKVHNQVDHDSLLESYEKFLHAMFRCTARPTGTILEKACLQHFPHASPGEIDKFVKAIQTCAKQSQACWDWQDHVSLMALGVRTRRPRPLLPKVLLPREQVPRESLPERLALEAPFFLSKSKIPCACFVRIGSLPVELLLPVELMLLCMWSALKKKKERLLNKFLQLH